MTVLSIPSRALTRVTTRRRVQAKPAKRLPLLTRYRGGTYSHTVDRVVFSDGTTARTDLIRLHPNVDAYSLDFTGIAPHIPSRYRLGTWSALPHLRKQGGGRFLFTSSVTGPNVAMPGTAHYAASKSGMNGLIRTAALEFARENITVNGVEPGYILTPAMAALGSEAEIAEMAKCIPLGKLGAPLDIANTMLFLASDEAAYITGQTIVVDGGSTLPESPVVLDAYYNSQQH